MCLPRHAQSPDNAAWWQNLLFQPRIKQRHIWAHFLRCSTATTTQACKTQNPKTTLSKWQTPKAHTITLLFYVFQGAHTKGLGLCVRKPSGPFLPAGQNIKWALVSMRGSQCLSVRVCEPLTLKLIMCESWGNIILPSSPRLLFNSRQSVNTNMNEWMNPAVWSESKVSWCFV